MTVARGYVGRLLASLAVLVAFVGCQDAAGPPEGNLSGPWFESVGADSSDVSTDSSDAALTPILQQAPDAPALETYQVSFWVKRQAKKDVSIQINYLPAPGESEGQPFLSFFVPKDALRQGGGGAPLAKGDSVYMTLTIDPVSFLVDFQPSGVTFNKKHPARMFLWYENANQDLNGDGVVNGTDQALENQLLIVYRAKEKAHWHKTKSMKGWTFPYVYADLRHFSQYAVSW